MADINRSNITLPADVSAEIIQKTQDASAVMSFARRVTLPGRGVAIPVITGDPDAEWVAETGKKPVSNSTLSTKILQPYKLAVIETFSMEFVRDAKALYDALVARLPLALAQKFDATVFGNVTAPGSNFDTLGAVTAQSLGSDAYAALVAADTDIASNGGIANGWVIAPQGKGKLLGTVDTTGRPLFINNVADGGIPQILGASTKVAKAAYKDDTVDTLGFVGDWTQAIYGTVEGVQISISDQATVGEINLWEQNMVAVRAEIEIGFRADTSVFNKITE